jgi:hypothetical protein
MTTLEEISGCEKANWKFWSREAKLMLALYREHRHSNNSVASSYRRGFKTEMRNRKNRKYFN